MPIDRILARGRDRLIKAPSDPFENSDLKTPMPNMPLFIPVRVFSRRYRALADTLPYPDPPRAGRRPPMRIFAVAAALSLLLALSWFSSLEAKAEEALYEAEARWSGAEGDRAKSYRRALHKVIARLAGKRSDERVPELETPAGRSLIEDAPAYVQGYREIVGRSEEGTSASSLHVIFDRASLEPRIRAARLPIWESPRPILLIRLALRDGDTRSMIGDPKASIRVPEAMRVLRQASRERGVPISFPLFEVDDLVREADPGAVDDARIRAASQRYRPGAILVGEIAPKEASSGWSAHFRLLLSAGSRKWEAEGESVDALVGDAAQRAMDILARGYFESETRGPSSKGALSVEVGGVHTFDDYVRTVRYLESLSRVESVELVAVEPERMIVDLRARTDAEGLRDLIAAGTTLVDDTRDTQALAPGVLALRLLP